MGKRLIGVGRTAHPGFDMVTFPAESGITNLNIGGYPADRRKNERDSAMIDFPVSSGTRLTGLTLEKKFDEPVLVGGKHVHDDRFRRRIVFPGWPDSGTSRFQTHECNEKNGLFPTTTKFIFPMDHDEVPA
jgi:hypothetical protein